MLSVGIKRYYNLCSLLQCKINSSFQCSTLPPIGNVVQDENSLTFILLSFCSCFIFAVVVNNQNVGEAMRFQISNYTADHLFFIESRNYHKDIFLYFSFLFVVFFCCHSLTLPPFIYLQLHATFLKKLKKHETYPYRNKNNRSPLPRIHRFL